MLNNQFLGSGKDFMELKDRELKDREEKIKRETEELFYKPIRVSKDDMDKFEEQEMKKIRPIKRNWFDQLIKQNVMGKKPNIIRDKLKDKIIIRRNQVYFSSSNVSTETTVIVKD